MSYVKKIISLEDGYKCFWTIRNFIQCKQNKGLTLESPKFKVDMFLDSEWCIKIEIFASCFDAYLYKSKGLSLSSSIRYSAYLLTSNGWQIILENKQEKFQSDGGGYGVDNLQWDTIYNGTLIICFHLWNGRVKDKAAQCVLQSEMINKKEILHLPTQEFTTLTPSYFSNVWTKSFLKIAPNISSRNKRIQTDLTEDWNRFNDFDDLLRLFKEKKFQYVILRTPSKEFAVQKALLCARSPVFNAMFDRDMKENCKNIVDIEDIDDDTLTLLLQFLHLESLENLKWGSAVKLFYAADKYQIMQLKSECITTFKKELTEENVCDALMLADMHNEMELMQSALEFFCRKSKTIIRSEKWKNLTLIKTELASGVLCKMAEMLLNLSEQEKGPGNQRDM